MSAKILLAEDNATNRYLATFMLERAGIQVRHGTEALPLALAEVPDPVLLDLDGCESARRIQADPALATIPTVAVTGYAMTGDRDNALRMGFAGYVEKPSQPQTFVREISHFPSERPVPI